MVIRPVNMNAYEFVVVSSLRAKQLLAGCVARLAGSHNAATMAQMEVAAGHVQRVDGDDVSPPQGEPPLSAIPHLDV
jgi:DNA-directed RNA polymerase subunit K/omega